jgi:hypothetical protein
MKYGATSTEDRSLCVAFSYSLLVRVNLAHGAPALPVIEWFLNGCCSETEVFEQLY